MKTRGIYKIINKVNGKYYVGSSLGIFGNNGRWVRHQQHLNNNSHPNKHLQNSWNKHTPTEFEIQMVEEVSDGNLLVVEQKYLDVAKTEQHKCYNQSFIADRVEMTDETKEKIRNSLMGRKHSDETKHKIKLSMIGKNHPMYGKHPSKETIEKLKLIQSGTNHPMYGKKHSQKSKTKMSISHRRRLSKNSVV